MKTPEIQNASPELSGQAHPLDLIITLTFFLFALACSFSISLTQIAAFTGLGFLLIRIHFTQSWKQLKLVLIWPFLGFLLAAILSTALSIDPEFSLPVFKKVGLFVVFLWVINAAPYINLRPFQKFLGRFIKSTPSISPLTLIIYMLIAATAVSALYGLTQGFYHGVSIASRSQIHSTFSHVFTFSTVLMMVNLMALAYLLFGTQNKPWLWISFLIMSLCLVFTFTRMAWVGFFVGGVVLFYFKKKILVIFPLMALIATLLIGPDSIAERLLSIADLDRGTTPIRLAMWKAGLDIIKDYPWTGCGYNCLYLIYDQYSHHPILQEYFYNLHSNLVQITVDLGLLGLGAWLTLWISYFVVLYRCYLKSSPTSPGRWVMLGSGVAVISFLIAGVFETNFYDSEVVMVLYFIMALPFTSSNNAQSAPSDPPSSAIPR